MVTESAWLGLDDFGRDFNIWEFGREKVYTALRRCGQLFSEL